MSVLASPLAGTVACHPAAPDDSVPDATLPAPKMDAAAPGPDADGTPPVVDASLASPDADGSPDDSGETIADACGVVTVDGAYIEGTSDGCVSFQSLPCGLPPTAQLEGCFVDLATCEAPCASKYFLFCQLAPVSCNDAGTVLDAATIIECISCQGITGRRPLGLCPPRSIVRTPVGDYFAKMAHLEAASVRAFGDLERWLARHGAPARLIRVARRSAREERRHARAAARLARRFGGVTSPPRVRRVKAPTLVELLEDDAVEGCVKETFGALLATWQAERAGDARVRRTLCRIAEDETRHAVFAWEILRWGMTRVSPADRRRVDQTLDRALVALETAAPAPVPREVREVSGHPAIEHERRLARALATMVRDLRERVTIPATGRV
jgi:rubrerythrin